VTSDAEVGNDDVGVEAEPEGDVRDNKGKPGIQHGVCWAQVKRINGIVGNKVKLVLTYIQILGLFKLEMTSISWPAWMADLTIFTRYIQIDVFEWTPISCAVDAKIIAKPFILKFYIYAYVQLGIIAIVLLFSLGLGRLLFRKPARNIWCVFASTITLEKTACRTTSSLL
jgi:hypothetical protein